ARRGASVEVAQPSEAALDDAAALVVPAHTPVQSPRGSARDAVRCPQNSVNRFCRDSRSAHIGWNHLVRSFENDDMFLGSKPTMSRPSRAISGGTVTTSRRPKTTLSGSTFLPK